MNNVKSTHIRHITCYGIYVFYPKVFGGCLFLGDHLLIDRESHIIMCMLQVMIRLVIKRNLSQNLKHTPSFLYYRSENISNPNIIWKISNADLVITGSKAGKICNKSSVKSMRSFIIYRDSSHSAEHKKKGFRCFNWNWETIWWFYFYNQSVFFHVGTLLRGKSVKVWKYIEN